MGEAQRIVAVVLAVLYGGCALPIATPSGMRVMAARRHEPDPSLLELASVDVRAGERPLLVIFPKGACSGSASGVLVDDEGHFLGAVAPGTAALLVIPTRLRRLIALSSVEVTAPVGVWHAAKSVQLPLTPSGLILHASRWNTRECGDGHYFDVAAATKTELETQLGESELRWLSPAREEGQAWLDAHHQRVADVLTRLEDALPDELTHSSLR